MVLITGAISRAKLQSNHHQTNTQFFTGWIPFLSPNQQCQSIEGKNVTSLDSCTPSSPGVFQLLSLVSLTSDHSQLLVMLWEGCHASHHPCDVRPEIITSCAGCHHNIRPPLSPWPFDLESDVRVTGDVGYHCANFSLPCYSTCGSFQYINQHMLN